MFLVFVIRVSNLPLCFLSCNFSSFLTCCCVLHPSDTCWRLKWYQTHLHRHVFFYKICDKNIYFFFKKKKKKTWKNSKGYVNSYFEGEQTANNIEHKNDFFKTEPLCFASLYHKSPKNKEMGVSSVYVTVSECVCHWNLDQGAAFMLIRGDKGVPQWEADKKNALMRSNCVIHSQSLEYSVVSIALKEAHGSHTDLHFIVVEKFSNVLKTCAKC